MIRAWLPSTFLLLTLLTFSGCALVGSHANLVNRPAKAPQSVAVIVLKEEEFPGQASDAVELSKIYALARELASRNLFQFKILDRDYTSLMLDKGRLADLGNELASKYDAYLIYDGNKTGRNYRVELKLYQSAGSLPLITARHNTSMGNSYMIAQPYSRLMIDATVGSVDAFEKMWRKIARGETKE